MSTFSRLAYIFSVLFLGFIFLSSGMAKLFAGHQFLGLIGPPWLEERLAEHGLALFARFVAYAQVSIGFLLLTYRFRTLGALMLVPMLANIMLVTVSQQWQGTPYVIAVFLLQNAYLLWCDRALLLPLVTGGGSLLHGQAPRLLPGNLVWLGGYGLLLASVQLSYLSLPVAWAATALAVGIGAFAGKWTRETSF
jgi:hypothetical protein